ncbi:MAG TPA: hypothetical protein VKD72_26945 [Gemmataceae bacterium]|nr:hypothetical protein [Gemmataceae bacterium]
MMKLRLSMVVLMVLLAFSLLVQVCTSADPAPTGQLRPNWKKLGLGDDQVKKIYTVQTEYRNKINDLEEQIKKLKEEQYKKELEVLTAAQKDRLKELGEFKDPTAPPKDEPKKDEPKKDPNKP